MYSESMDDKNDQKVGILEKTEEEPNIKSGGKVKRSMWKSIKRIR